MVCTISHSAIGYLLSAYCLLLSVLSVLSSLSPHLLISSLFLPITLPPIILNRVTGPEETPASGEPDLFSEELHGFSEGHLLSPRASELSEEDSWRHDSKQKNIV